MEASRAGPGLQIAAIKAKLKVILCIGETLNEKKRGKTKSTLSKQIRLGLDRVQKKSKIFFGN